MRAKSITVGATLAALVLVCASPAMAERAAERPKLDLDEDGYVTPEEFAQSRLSERVEFSAIDANGDELITMDELKEYAKANRGGRRGGRRNSI